jgi:hypothetical protein
MHSFRSIAALKRLSLVPRLLLLPLLAFTAFATSQPRTVNATIDTTKTGAPISRYIYGLFLEHGGDIVNTGLADAGKLWCMAPDSVDATAQVDNKPEVQVEDQTLGPPPDIISLHPFSVNIYSYPLREPRVSREFK